MNPPTAWTLRRRRAPLCPVCSHRSRLVKLFQLDAGVCRWGHVIGRETLYRLELGWIERSEVRPLPIPTGGW